MVVNVSNQDFQKSLTQPTVLLSFTRAAYIGPSLQLSAHKNAVATVAITLDAPFELTFFDRCAATPSVAMQTEIALIAPHTLHHLQAQGRVIFIYLDALSRDFAQLQQLDLMAAYNRFLNQCSNPAHAHMLQSLDALCAALGLSQTITRTSRLIEVINKIDERPQDFESIRQAAHMANISVSRFQYLFKQSAGMPFRRYRLWRRMVIVMHHISQGHSLTYAAHSVGFASSAHLSAAFKTMFGIQPSSFISLGAQFKFVG
jgi:AraC-like DNA-binding protein